jgi:putative SOS response-associated peptidase YedK
MIEDPMGERLNISGSKLAQGVFDELFLKMTMPANDDLRPTQTVNVITHDNHKLHEVLSIWGVKPSWSKKLLINAQAETVAVNLHRQVPQPCIQPVIHLI